jgi:hypothetical protein
MHHDHGYSRFEFHFMRDAYVTFDNFIVKTMEPKVAFHVPFLFLLITIALTELISPSMFHFMVYVLTIRNCDNMWKEILRVKSFSLFINQPLISLLSVFSMIIFILLWNTDFYFHYFIYQDCIICFEKVFFGHVFQCCPYVKVCHTCKKKLECCPICKSQFSLIDSSR